MTDMVQPDRRLHPRAYVPAVASLVLDSAIVGKCLVRNLSQSGALLLGAPALAPGTVCELVLAGPGIGTLRLAGQSVRARATEGESGLAVRFCGIPADVEEQLRRVVEDAQASRALPSTLVVNPDVATLVDLALDLERLGRRPLLAITPLEAVRWLCDGAVNIEAVLVGSNDLGGSGADLLAFIGEECPGVHRVLVHGELSASETLALVSESKVRAKLLQPWTLDSLRAALEHAPGSLRAPLRRTA